MNATLRRLQLERGARFCPEDAINLGYLFYRLTVLQSHQEDPRHAEVEHAIARRNNLFAKVEDDECGTQLVMAIKEAAISYCDGLLRTNKVFDEKVQMAEDRNKAATKNRILTATKSGLFRGAVKLFIIGITVFSAVLAVATARPATSPDLNTTGLYTGFAIAGMVVLVTIWFEITKLSATQDELFFKYGLSQARARVERQAHFELELRAAWGMAERDFKRILGESIDSEDGALEALIGPIRERRDEYERDMKRYSVELEQSAVRRVLVMLGFAASQPKQASPKYEL